MNQTDILAELTTIKANATALVARIAALGQSLASPFEAVETAAPVPTGPPLPIALPAAAKWVTPHERDVAAYYGPADPKGRNVSDGGTLEWFRFPVDDIRLYSRHGDHLKDRGGDGRDDHRCHKSIVVNLENALLAVYHGLGKERFYAEGWHVFSGCWYYRQKKLGSSLSMHAYALAIDLNDSENPLHSKTTSFSPEGVDIMEEWGWLWGPRAWGMPKYDADNLGLYVDPMHFQRAIPVLDSKSWYAVNGLPKRIQVWQP